jgi:hypothetical protein
MSTKKTIFLRVCVFLLWMSGCMTPNPGKMGRWEGGFERLGEWGNGGMGGWVVYQKTEDRRQKTDGRWQMAEGKNGRN